MPTADFDFYTKQYFSSGLYACNTWSYGDLCGVGHLNLFGGTLNVLLSRTPLSITKKYATDKNTMSIDGVGQ